MPRKQVEVNAVAVVRAGADLAERTRGCYACRWVSLLGAAMSAMYSTIAFAASVAAGTQGASYELRRESKALQIFGAFNALGTVMFAFGGHAILLEVQVRAGGSIFAIAKAASGMC